ncbi:MAG TPA: hypothetical protein VHU23_04620 [Rhizomicrobium sp.]|jgi:hypothetical protein|nr:hypothetical protein [Rhizomicrobium sp.]
MRTTLTIDEDVAVALERMRKSRNASLKEIVNDVLRRGLKDANTPHKPRRAFRTRSVDLGNSRLPNLDNVAEILAIAEGEDFR